PPAPTPFVCQRDVSCQGFEACAGTPSGFYNPDGSCNGDRTCKNENTYNGQVVGAKNTIAFCSCNGDEACINNRRNIGNNSCNAKNACALTVGDAFIPHPDIGSDSCNAEKACCGWLSTVAPNSCNKPGECCDPANCPGGCPNNNDESY
ncbi:hypothetical protein ACHAWC_000600, partial [Mediolabrus comicus]